MIADRYKTAQTGAVRTPSFSKEGAGLVLAQALLPCSFYVSAVPTAIIVCTWFATGSTKC